MAATAVATDSGASLSRPNATHPNPHAIAVATAQRPPNDRASTIPATAAATTTATADSTSTVCATVTPLSVSAAATFATAGPWTAQ